MGVCNAPSAPVTPPEPRLDYLAKDYDSFRRLMLDRMAQLVPGFAERSPADFTVALVETLAYVGDHLSYTQDAVATEAYLGTARRRTSLRRHARPLKPYRQQIRMKKRGNKPVPFWFSNRIQPSQHFHRIHVSQVRRLQEKLALHFN